MENIEKIKWHPAFYGGLMYVLSDYKNDLEYHEEYTLSKEPVRMDCLIIKKNRDVEIKTSFGRMFRKYNVLEYKSPDDGLTIDDFFKTVGYAALYKGYGSKVDQIPTHELTLSIFRHRYPRKLFQVLKKLGCKVNQVSSGVYYIEGFILIPVQVVVTAQLEKGAYEALRILTPNAEEDEVRRFIIDTDKRKEPGDRQNADAVLQASVSANRELYEQIRRENSMCEALRELMRDEIEADKNKARTEANAEVRADIASEMLRAQEPISKIIRYTGITEKELENLANEIGVKVIEG